MVNRALLIALTAGRDLLRAVRSLLPWFQVAGVYYLLLVCLQNLRRVGSVWTGSRSAEASLIVVVHLLLRLHVAHIALRVEVVVSFIICYLVRVVQHVLWTLMVALKNHGTA